MRFVIPDLVDPNAHPKAMRRAVARQQQEMRQAFREHNERLRPLLPLALQRLQETDLSDGKIRSVQIDSAQKTLQLGVLYGNRQQGYFDLTLHYQAILLTPMETSLLYLIAHKESAEIAWDEIDHECGAGNPVLLHRICWNTCIPIAHEKQADGRIICTHMLQPEIELRFESLELQITPRSARDGSLPSAFSSPEPATLSDTIRA